MGVSVFSLFLWYFCRLLGAQRKKKRAKKKKKQRSESTREPVGAPVTSSVLAKWIEPDSILDDDDEETNRNTSHTKSSSRARFLGSLDSQPTILKSW